MTTTLAPDDRTGRLRDEADEAPWAAVVEAERPGGSRVARDAALRRVAELYEAGGLPGHAWWCRSRLTAVSV